MHLAAAYLMDCVIDCNTRTVSFCKGEHMICSSFFGDRIVGSMLYVQARHIHR